MAVKAKKKPKKLTALQQRFVDEMIACGIGAKSARLAGASPKSAGNQAMRWMMNDEIRAAVDEGRRQLANTVRFDAATVLNELAVLATVIPLEELITEDGYLKGDLKDLTPEVRACIASIEKNDWGFKIKFHDRIKALQLAGKHKAVRAYTEEIEVTDALSDRLDQLLQERGTNGKQG